MMSDSIDYQLLFENLPGCYLALKPDLVIVAVSAGLELATGKEKSQLLGSALIDVFPDIEQSLYTAFQHVLQHQEAHEQTLASNPLAPAQIMALPHKWRSRAWPVLSSEGGIRYLLYSLEQLPEIAPTAGLSAEEEQFRLLANTLPLHVWTARPDGQIDYINERLITYSGTRVEDFGPQNWLSLLHADDRSAAAACWQEAVLTGRNYETQLRVRRADGAYRWFLAQAQPQRNAAGQVVRWYGTSTDVEEQYQLRQQFIANEQHLQQILSQVPAQVATLLGPEHVYGFINEQAQQLLGAAVKPGMIAAQARPSLVETGYISLLDQVYRTGKPFELLEMPTEEPGLYGAPSRALYFDGALRPLTDEEGQIQGVLVFGMDVTERVQAKQRTAELMEEVREQDRQFEQVMEGLPQMVWVSGPAGDVTYYNQRWYDFTGSNFEEMQGWGWEKLLHPDDQPITAQRWKEAVNQGAIFEMEHRWRDRQGNYRWFLARGEAIRAANGTILRWVGTNTDIDEQKRFQQQLAAKDEQLRQILRQSPALIATLEGPNHRYTFTNPGYDQFVSSRAKLGQPVAECLPELVEQGFVKLLNQVYQINEPYVGRETLVQLRHPTTGEMREQYLDFVYQPLYDARGQTQGILSFAVDVTEQVRARQQTATLQAELRGREEQFRFLSESIPQIVWTAGADGLVDYFNQRLWEATGRHPHKSLGDAAWLHIIHPDDQPRTQLAWQEAARTGSKYETECRFVSRTGSYRWFLSRAEPLRNTAGEIIKWFGSCTDIDDFKQAQQRLQTQNKQLLRINQDLDNFVYTASHDLRQPIYNMAGIFEELTRTTHFKDPEAAELVAMFEEALQRIYGTIQDLADIVQVQRRQEQVPAEPIAVLPLIQAVIRGMHEQVEEAGGKFELDTAAVPTLWFVRSNLQSVLYNLLSNALKYAMPGRPARIRVRTDLVNGEPVLTVADNGLGIDLDRHGAELFQMFRRFHDHVAGSGIGLHLMNRIVQQAGGRVEVESTVGEGTTFRVYFSAP